LPQNADGDFFVDSTCVDCGACRQIVPRRAEPIASSMPPRGSGDPSAAASAAGLSASILTRVAFRKIARREGEIPLSRGGGL
jgi:hypothetical protein